MPVSPPRWPWVPPGKGTPLELSCWIRGEEQLAGHSAESPLRPSPDSKLVNICRSQRATAVPQKLYRAVPEGLTLLSLRTSILLRHLLGASGQQGLCPAALADRAEEVSVEGRNPCQSPTRVEHARRLTGLEMQDTRLMQTGTAAGSRQAGSGGNTHVQCSLQRRGLLREGS